MSEEQKVDWSEKKFVLTAVNKDGRALKHASENFQNDKEVVLAAVNKDGHALVYASDELKNDPVVVLAAMMQYPNAIIYSNLSNSTVKPILDSIKELRKLVKASQDDFTKLKLAATSVRNK